MFLFQFMVFLQLNQNLFKSVINMNEIIYLKGKKSIDIILISDYKIIEINIGNLNIIYNLIGYK